MRFSCVAIILIVCIVICSIFVANVANLINIDGKLAVNFDKDQPKQRHGSAAAHWIDRNNVADLHIDDKADHLIWFLQISDLHISIFSDNERITQFQEFATKTLDTIQPSVVLASGDLTDAKDADFLGSRQYEREWQIYRDIIDTAGVRNKTLWMDIRGNHDNFNVPGDHSDWNYFREYSVQGTENKRSYMKQVAKGGEKYSFIAVDACLEPGPKRPFNFIGVLSLNDTRHIIDLAEESRRNGGNYTIWFGHYPTSCIVSMETGSVGLRKLIGHYDEGLAYLCGHLHTLGGMVPNMYTLQHDGFLELELGDWKKNRTYRLAAIDHGIFSFTDVIHNDWPIVLVTNPKHALFHIPEKDNLLLQRESSHIRILAFSPSGIVNCSVRINGGESQKCAKVTESLFVVKWTAEMYAKGVHNLEVLVVDGENRQKRVSQPFSLDGSRVTFNLLARLILMSDASTIFQIFFGIALSMCVVPLLLLRTWHILVTVGYVKRPRLNCTNWFSVMVRRLWILSTIDRIFLPIIIYCFYLIVGPWSIGEVIDGHMGIIFAWGIYVNGGYLPGSLTYLYGFFQLLFCQLPLIVIYAYCTETCYLKYVGISMNKKHSYFRNFKHLPFIFIIIIEFVLAVFFWHAYGTIAFILGPFRTWSVILNFLLWHLARHIPDKCLSSSARLWGNGKLNINSDTYQVSREL